MCIRDSIITESFESQPGVANFDTNVGGNFGASLGGNIGANGATGAAIANAGRTALGTGKAVFGKGRSVAGKGLAAAGKTAAFFQGANCGAKHTPVRNVLNGVSSRLGANKAVNSIGSLTFLSFSRNYRERGRQLSQGGPNLFANGPDELDFTGVDISYGQRLSLIHI